MHHAVAHRLWERQHAANPSTYASPKSQLSWHPWSPPWTPGGARLCASPAGVDKRKLKADPCTRVHLVQQHTAQKACNTGMLWHMHMVLGLACVVCDDFSELYAIY